MPPDKLLNIKMQAFRGVPTDLVVDLEGGRSIVVYGDNATGKSTIADAVEVFFTGNVELLTREGREHALRHLNAQASLKTMVSVATSGTLGGSVSYPDELPGPRRIPEQETFCYGAARSPTLLIRPRARSGKHWLRYSV